MTDVWSGNILLPDGKSIKDVGFTSHNITSSPAIPAASLRFLSTVDTAKIPLYLAAGPSYDVWTTSEASEAWFESILLNQPIPETTTGDGGTHEWWTLTRAQSPIGILAQIQNQVEDVLKPRVTEVLFYGTISAEPAIEGLLPELRVHALPLSSDLLYQQAASALPHSPNLSSNDQLGGIDAQFLPPLHTVHGAPKSPKRKRDLFEEATIAKRNARGKGGEGIAAAAARANESQRPYVHRKSISIDSKVSPHPDSRPPSAHAPLSRPSSRQLSRSPSITADIRPLSRKDTAEAHGKRSNLSRVDTISSQPEEPTIESRNKEALTKVVMAAMRMHGLQQRKKTKSRRTSAAPGLEESQPMTDEIAAEDAAKDEEFKLIYHQTFKGATLALRTHIASKPLHTQPDRLRDLVEQFLTLFLTDPLAPPPPPPPSSEEPANVATPSIEQPGFFTSSNHHASPFDLPSGARRPPMLRSQTDGQVYTGSPVSRRKTRDGRLEADAV